MTNPATPGFPGPALAEFAYRAIHSRLVDLLEDAPPQMRDYIVKQLGGRRTFGALMRAIAEGRARLDVFLDDETEQPILELSVMAGDGDPFELLQLDGPSVGVDPAYLIREQQYRLDQALAEIRGGAA
jgi:hypothetical protein